MKRAKSISVASNGHRVDMPYHVFNYQGDTFVAHVGLGHPLKISHVGIAIAGRAVTRCRIRGESRIVLGRVFNPVYPSPCDLTPEDSAELERQMNEIVIPMLNDANLSGGNIMRCLESIVSVVGPINFAKGHVHGKSHVRMGHSLLTREIAMRQNIGSCRAHGLNPCTQRQ